jgi:hypothetical protein
MKKGRSPPEAGMLFPYVAWIEVGLKPAPL